MVDSHGFVTCANRHQRPNSPTKPLCPISKDTVHPVSRKESASDVSFDVAGTRQAPARGRNGLESHRVNRGCAARAQAVLITQQAEPRVADIVQCTAKIVDQSVPDFPRQGVAGGAGCILTGPSRLPAIVLVGPLIECNRSEFIDRAVQTPFLGIEQARDSPLDGVLTGSVVFEAGVHDPNVNQATRRR